MYTSDNHLVAEWTVIYTYNYTTCSAKWQCWHHNCSQFLKFHFFDKLIDLCNAIWVLNLKQQKNMDFLKPTSFSFFFQVWQMIIEAMNEKENKI